MIFLPSLALTAQQAHPEVVHGTVSEPGGNGKPVPLPGVNVFWLGTTTGTVTDTGGHFHIEMPDNNKSGTLVFSYIGYLSDTLFDVKKGSRLEIVMDESRSLSEVEIAERTPGAHISRTDPIATQNITLGELQKAACCNLSESFETNASVDVSYSDAVSGARHIKLLGLAGRYSQIQTENIPNLRGLGSSFGLSYIPGSWMESIQVSKGAASVKNGYESITGQINVEYKKPDNHEKFFLNLYVNSFGKAEGNINSSIRINERWSTALFGHVENMSFRMDHNHDSFLDEPLMTQYNLFNRWKYENGNIRAQFGAKFLNEERRGGQSAYHDAPGDVFPPSYGTGIRTNRFEGFAKSAYLFDSRPATSFGFINSFIYHEMNSFFGLKEYDARQWNYYGNLMFQSYIGNTHHSFTTGISYLYDRYDERLNDTIMDRTESVPGAFLEYTYLLPDKLTLLLGARIDHHNLHGVFFTPRLHAKYELFHHTILRLSAGKGFRSANAIADNISLLVNSRQIVFAGELRMEEAWNYGLNVTQYVDILGRELTVSAEVYRTEFRNQAIVDLDADHRHIYIYNLQGESYANILQIEAKYEVVPGMEMLAAFRYNDVMMTTAGELRREPFISKYKGLITISYQTPMKRWQFDFTTQFNGTSRLPDTDDNPEPYRRPGSAPAYTILNTQVTKYFKRWDLYIGGENLTGFTQDHPIIAADDPYGPYFDGSSIWGPVTGLKLYAGLRMKL